MTFPKNGRRCQLVRVAKNSFGMNHEVIKLIYQHGIVPFFIYGSLVWDRSISQSRTTTTIKTSLSYEAVFVLPGVLSIDLEIQLNNEVSFPFGGHPSPDIINGPLWDIPNPRLLQKFK
ncbi:hypothetical protein AVEN_265331-1 [Araneus ventricosus]|uniref:Uncharacterized protein n=1 Tax=Araneus ventricosus TaxID=182803 RepID=A0A4Y2BVL4_ARAVE|nr:hypothetical protein AVEN_265331-1 [Araneus ventricosus]